MASPFAIVPIEIIRDDRLTKIQLRVLIALLSYKNKATGLLWPKREDVAERCGYDVRTITKATTALVKLGYLKKTGNGGRSKSNLYRITVPEPDTLCLNETVPESGLQTVPEPGPQTVPEPDTKRCPNRTGALNRPITDHRTDQLTYQTRARINQPGTTRSTFERLTDRSWAEGLIEE